MEVLSIIIAIQHPILLEGVREILKAKTGFNVIGVTDEVDELEALLSNKQGNLILDLDLPDQDGTKIIKNIAKKYSELRILAIGENQNTGDIKEIFQAGAAGYVYKDQSTEDLIKALKKINQGGIYLADKAIRKLYDEGGESSNPRSASVNLTDRETEILDLICREMTNREIAEELSISIRTVDTHRSNILQKTGARNTAGLVKFAIRNEIFVLN